MKVIFNRGTKRREVHEVDVVFILVKMYLTEFKSSLCVFSTMRVGQDDILGLQGGRCGIVERQAVEVDGVVAHEPGEAGAPLGALRAVSGVQQEALRHHLVVDVSCAQHRVFSQTALLRKYEMGLKRQVRYL